MFEWSSLFIEGAQLCGEDWNFQHDKAAIHTVRRSNIFFHDNNIRLLDHQPYSQDFNTIENLWR